MRQFGIFVLSAAFAGLAAQAVALEAATVPSGGQTNRAIVARVNVERTQQFADVAAMQAEVDRMKVCMAKGKFYAPGKSGADGNGCTPIPGVAYP